MLFFLLSGEDADGYEFEYYEVEQTLEEWAEEKMSGAANRMCRSCWWVFCCCGCCPCYDRSEEISDIKLLDPHRAMSLDGLI